MFLPPAVAEKTAQARAVATADTAFANARVGVSQARPAVIGAALVGATFLIAIIFFVVFALAYDHLASNESADSALIENSVRALSVLPDPRRVTRDPQPTPTSTPAQPAKPPIEEADDTPLPERVTLNVPFTTQAPYGKWVQPYEDACEEASVLMVRAFLAGETGRIPATEADREIIAMTDFEAEQYGLHHSTSMAETKRFLEALYPELEAEILPMTGTESVLRLLAQGHPVILPVNGREINNPNFQNGGPPYHVLVVKGYTPTHFITNDPGTRLGEGFVYTHEDLTDAVHDWNGGDVRHGEQIMMILRLKR